MKVLHVINSLSTGGAEKLIVETLPLLNKFQDLNVDLALLNGSESPFYTEFTNTQSNVHLFKLSKSSVYNPLLIFRIIPLLRRYDIIHVHLFPSQYYVVIAKIISFSKVKLIFTEHSTNNRRLSNRLFRVVDKFFYRFYKKIICISPEVKVQLRRLLKIEEEKLPVIINGVNISKVGLAVAHPRNEFGYSSEDVLLVKVAGFRVEKDHETLLKTLVHLPPKFKLLLIGDGERRAEIELLISNLKLGKRVQTLGVRSDVPSVLKMCDICVISSHWEGFGLVAVEAMASGIPVIASNVEGLAQVVEGGGLLFEQGNRKDLEQKILSLASNSEAYVRYVHSGKVKSTQFSMDLMVNRIHDLYKNVND